MNKYKMPIREQNSNKGTFGKVLNLSGSKNYIGAAYLSSISPLKVGAGFVALATEKNVIRSVSTLLAEAVYLSREEAFKQFDDYNVYLVGCGLGLTYKSELFFKKVIKKIKDKPTIIDADGLNLLAKTKISCPKNCILTPHPLEAARLLNMNLASVLSDLEGCAKQLYEKYKAVIILKTHRTIIYDGYNLFINQCGNSALAKAGSGDVLAGIIAGLLAQGMELFEAAKLGVYLHARSGEIASNELTEYCVLASDLPNYLHYAIKENI